MAIGLLERQESPDLAPFPTTSATDLEQANSGPDPRTRSLRSIIMRVIKYVALGLAGFLLVGNLLILAASAWATDAVSGDTSVAVSGVENFRVVDERVWRGGAPTDAGYRSLAEAGVAAVVDLRAEDDISPPAGSLESQDVEFVHVPIRDGQLPSEEQVARFMEVVRESDGPVFVHCGAGVGRSGAMVAAYLRAAGEADSSERVSHNLSVGPPSLEQIVYAASDDADRPNIAVTAASRVLDSPRRIFHNLGF